MSTQAFIARFRALHDKAKTGSLLPNEREEYQRSRVDLERLMTVAQTLGRPTGKTLRSALRVAQLVKVDIEVVGASPMRTSTVDLASGGFAALLPASQPLGRLASFTLHLPSFGSGRPPMKGTARVASAQPQGTVHRVSFSFEQIEPGGLEHLEIVIIDSVLSRFEKPV